MHTLQLRIHKMEFARYLTLQQRMQLTQMKKVLINLHEYEVALHSHKFTIGF